MNFAEFFQVNPLELCVLLILIVLAGYCIWFMIFYKPSGKTPKVSGISHLVPGSGSLSEEVNILGPMHCGKCRRRMFLESTVLHFKKTIICPYCTAVLFVPDVLKQTPKAQSTFADFFKESDQTEP